MQSAEDYNQQNFLRKFGTQYGPYGILTIFIIGNSIGGILGMAGFVDQFIAVLQVPNTKLYSWFLLLFIADCPMSIFFFIIFLIKRNPKWLSLIAFSGLLEGIIGYSAISALDFLGIRYAIYPFFEPVSYISHAIMFLEALIILPYLRNLNRLDYFIAGTWIVLNDIFDVFTATVPFYPFLLTPDIPFRIFIGVLWIIIDLVTVGVLIFAIRQKHLMETLQRWIELVLPPIFKSYSSAKGLE